MRNDFQVSFTLHRRNLKTQLYLILRLGWSPSQPLLGSSHNASPPLLGSSTHGGGEALRDDPNNSCEGDYG